mgnify:FL=1
MLVLLIFIMAFSVMDCSVSSADAGEEVVFVRKPIIFGFMSGIIPEPLIAGETRWTLFTTSDETYIIYPTEYKENFNDLITADNNPVDFDAFLELKIVDNKTPLLHEIAGVNWYKNKIAKKFRGFIRNFGRGQTMFALTTDGAVTDSMALSAWANIEAYILEQGLPLEVVRVNIGKVTPPQLVLDETIKTAAQKQRQKTEDARAAAELNRAAAELNKATADKAYKKEFNMTNSEYLRLRELEIQKEIVELAKDNENVDLLINIGNDSVQPMKSIGR